MEATVSPRATGRGLIRRKADYIPPSRYTLRAAASDGDALTRLSFLILGAGNLARRQIVKGVFFLAVEVAYIAYMVAQGVGSLVTLGTLGYRTQTKHKVDGYWYYDAGDNSVLLLTAGVATVFITVLFAVFWSYAVRSAYKAQVLQRETGAAPTLLDDWHNLTDRNAQVSMMFLPVVGILVFTVLPTLIMVFIAFTSYDSDHVLLFDWVGVKNFGQLFSSTGAVTAQQFVRVLGWTLVWAIFATFLNFFFGLFLAMIINRKTTRFKGMWRSIFSLSMAVPQFVSLLAINQMLQPEGAINSMLESWGWITDPLPFFTDPTWARVTVIVVNLWIGIPFTIMQITGILQNIPADQYEAARIDGANWWQTVHPHHDAVPGVRAHPVPDHHVHRQREQLQRHLSAVRRQPDRRRRHRRLHRPAHHLAVQAHGGSRRLQPRRRHRHLHIRGAGDRLADHLPQQRIL